VLRILDLCGGTGSWSQPYADAGYDVVIVDPAQDTGDVRLLSAKQGRIHGILAAPPCTVFASSGARWWHGKGQAAVMEGLSVVDACLRVVAIQQPVWWALENPVGRLRTYLGDPLLSFDPSDYGDPYTKRTLLWGRFRVPLRRPVQATEGSKMHRLGPSARRAALRSVTPPGFARAFFEVNP
jgi:hypothetical protein